MASATTSFEVEPDEDCGWREMRHFPVKSALILADSYSHSIAASVPRLSTEASSLFCLGLFFAAKTI
jgi:hypothetical protein